MLENLFGPAMGMNAYFAFTVVPALGCVFFSAVLFIGMAHSPAREWLINALPKSLKLAIAGASDSFLR